MRVITTGQTNEIFLDEALLDVICEFEFSYAGFLSEKYVMLAVVRMRQQKFFLKPQKFLNLFNIKVFLIVLCLKDANISDEWQSFR